MVYGGSVGGMLMGVVVNLVFNLFGVIIVDVFFVDVLIIMCDEMLLLMLFEWLEWGNLLIDKDVYVIIKLYLFYDNVSW